MVLACAAWGLAGAARAQPPDVRTFDFKIRLKTDNPGQKIDVPRGAFLASHRDDDRDVIYQPIVLCHEIAVTTDAKGETDWIDVHGFCPSPGVPVPPKGVTFTILTFSVDEVWEKGCDDQELLKKIRHRFKTRPPAINPQARRFECRGADLPRCIRDFNRQLYESGLDHCKTGDCISAFKNQERCDISLDKKGMDRLFVAYCDATLW